MEKSKSLATTGRQGSSTPRGHRDSRELPDVSRVAAFSPAQWDEARRGAGPRRETMLATRTGCHIQSPPDR